MRGSENCKFFQVGTKLQHTWNLCFHLQCVWNLPGICLESKFSTGINPWNLLAINIFQLESTWNLPWNLHFPRESAWNLLATAACNMLATEQSHVASKKTCSFPNPDLAGGRHFFE